MKELEVTTGNSNNNKTYETEKYHHQISRYYRATWATFKPKLEKIKNIHTEKKNLIFPETEIPSIMFLLYFRMEYSELEKKKSSLKISTTL